MSSLNYQLAGVATYMTLVSAGEALPGTATDWLAQRQSRLTIAWMNTKDARTPLYFIA